MALSRLEVFRAAIEELLARVGHKERRGIEFIELTPSLRKTRAKSRIVNKYGLQVAPSYDSKRHEHPTRTTPTDAPVFVPLTYRPGDLPRSTFEVLVDVDGPAARPGSS